MPIRYKVVKRKTRMSAVINGNSIYAIQYLKGSKVFARPETLGIMTFKSRYDAVNWKDGIEYHEYNNHWDGDDVHLKVIAVETIGRGKVPKSISSSVRSDRLKSFYKNPHYRINTNPVDRTVCYPGVRVLE